MEVNTRRGRPVYYRTLVDYCCDQLSVMFSVIVIVIVIVIATWQCPFFFILHDVYEKVGGLFDYQQTAITCFLYSSATFGITSVAALFDRLSRHSLF